MKFNRRQFIRNTSLISSTCLMPQFLKALNITNGLAFEGKKLIIVQLSGGNDGLNMLVPYTNDLYYSLRPQISLSTDLLINLNNMAALNNKLPHIADMYNHNEALFINSVGYPNPNRSHFRSMDIWHTASDADKYIDTGWIGRWLDNSCNVSCSIPQAIEIDGSLSLALKGSQVKGLAIDNISHFKVMAEGNLIKNLSETTIDGNEEQIYLYKTLTETVQAASYIDEKMKSASVKTVFPLTSLGKQLQTIAQYIQSGFETPVYYTSISGFDTHVQQKGAQARLFTQLDDALFALKTELKLLDEWKNTVVLVFSEFGRRVKENAGGGTDHGAANCTLLLGGGLKKGGIYNSMPDLKNLKDGDIIMEVDFRQIYASLLSQWLKADDHRILNKQFDHLALFP